VEGEEGRGWEVSGVGNPANSTHVRHSIRNNVKVKGQGYKVTRRGLTQKHHIYPVNISR